MCLPVQLTQPLVVFCQRESTDGFVYIAILIPIVKRVVSSEIRTSILFTVCLSLTNHLQPISLSLSKKTGEYPYDIFEGKGLSFFISLYILISVECVVSLSGVLHLV